MTKEKIVSTKNIKTIEEVADFLIMIGTKLKDKKSFELSQGNTSVEILPKERIQFELNYEIDESNKYELEIELKWSSNDTDKDQTIQIS